MSDENGQKFDIIMSGIARIEAEVRTLVPSMAVVEKRHEDCEAKKVFEASRDVQSMRKEGVWDAINSEKGRKARRRIWYSVSAAMLCACIFAGFRLILFLSNLAAQVGG